MKSSVDNKMVEAARDAAKPLRDSGAERAEFRMAMSADNPNPGLFVVQTNPEGLLVLGQVEVHGEAYYLGIDISRRMPLANSL